MATLDHFRPATTTSLLTDIAARVRAWSDRRATARALDGLTDRELADLGLERGDVAAIADGSRPARRL